jgi:transcriptional regulator with PAS, ATPase and Fis domain
VRGESGTGKNLLANAIHNESFRREGPFFIFPCSSIPNELVITELLGYDAGFSNKRPGGRPSKFELAQGGTLYFQDVDALPLEAQSVLLNVLDLGMIQRLGSDHPIPVDVRIIASSSADMERLIAQGNFRADLFYRLSTFEITIPPLRERLQDIPLLADRILIRLARQHSRPLSLAPDVIQLFKKYDWPGNVRELEAVLGRAVLQAGVSEVVGPMHIPESIRYPRSDEPDRPYSYSPAPLFAVERQVILEAAQYCNGNVSEMARMLGIGRTTLWRKLKQFNISAKDFKRIMAD